MNKKKNQGIELLRFVFAIAVIFHHGFQTFYDSKQKLFLFRNGWIGVEFFFLVSGLLMASHVLRRSEKDGIAEKTSVYMLGRYRAVFLPHLCCFLLLFVEHVVFDRLSMVGCLIDLLKALPEMLLVHMSGLQLIRINMNDWYLSSLLLCSMAIYPLLRKMKRAYTTVAAPLLSLVTYGIMFQQTGSLTPSNVWCGLFLKGTIRAFAGINLGIFLYELSAWIDAAEISKPQKALLWTVELAAYLVTFGAASFALSKDLYFPVVLILAIGVAITFSRFALWQVFLKEDTFPGRAIQFVGKTSLYIYLSQRVVLQLVVHAGVKNQHISMTIFAAGAILFGILLYYVFEKKRA